MRRFYIGEKYEEMIGLKESEVIHMASDAQNRAFINKVAPIFQDQARKHGNKIFPSIGIAQACNESGYGTSAKMIRANAIMGIKVGKSAWKFGTAWKGKAYKTGTTEYYDGKNATKITDYFRAYDSLEDAIEDYFDLLCTAKRYKNALNRSTPEEFIKGIQEAPYATDPQYISKILSIVKKYNLTQYDSSSNVSKPKSETNSKTNNPYPVPTKLLKNGSRGNEVRWLQFALNQHGYKLSVDGIFGAKTEQAVRDFQSRHKLICDGLVGQQTRTELQR